MIAGSDTAGPTPTTSSPTAHSSAPPASTCASSPRNCDWRSSTRCNADTTAQGTCNPDGNVDAGAAREKVDMRLGWSAPSGKWGVGAVVTNLTNRQYVTVSTLGSVVCSPYSCVSKPRTVALELRGAL